ncbi:MAG: hypothetical protein AAGF20_01010 [Pseudomonadota bacterium]
MTNALALLSAQKGGSSPYRIFNGRGTSLVEAPGQNALAAFEQGRSVKGGMQMNNALADGDYGGAAQAAYGMGDTDRGLQLTQIQGQQDQAKAQQAMADRRAVAETAYNFMQNMTSLPENQRLAFAQQNWQTMQEATGMGWDQFLAQNGGQVSDQALADDMAQLRTVLGMAPERIEGKVVNGRLVNPFTAEEMGDFSDPVERRTIKGADGYNYYQDTGERVLPGVQAENQPKTQQDALGRLRFVDGPNAGQIVPGFDEARPRSNGVTVYGPDGKPIAQVGGDAAKAVKVSSDAMTRFATGLPAIRSGVQKLEEMENAGYSLEQDLGAEAASVLPGVGGYLSRKLGGDDYQVYQQAFSAFESQIMPILSGAAVSVEEAQRLIRAGLPQLGDGPVVTQRKQQFRRSMLSAIEAMVMGKPYDIDAISAEAAQIAIGQNGSQTTTTQIQPGTIEEGFRFKGGDPADPANWEQVQ